jgi:hypothetical protein
MAPSARSAYGSSPVLSARWRLIEKDSNGSKFPVRDALCGRPLFAVAHRVAVTGASHDRVLTLGHPEQ